jgi:hypothetical protein
MMEIDGAVEDRVSDEDCRKITAPIRRPPSGFQVAPSTLSCYLCGDGGVSMIYLGFPFDPQCWAAIRAKQRQLRSVSKDAVRVDNRLMQEQPIIWREKTLPFKTTEPSERNRARRETTLEAVTTHARSTINSDMNVVDSISLTKTRYKNWRKFWDDIEPEVAFQEWEGLHASQRGMGMNVVGEDNQAVVWVKDNAKQRKATGTEFKESDTVEQRESITEDDAVEKRRRITKKTSGRPFTHAAVAEASYARGSVTPEQGRSDAQSEWGLAMFDDGTSIDGFSVSNGLMKKNGGVLIEESPRLRLRKDETDRSPLEAPASVDLLLAHEFYKMRDNLAKICESMSQSVDGAVSLKAQLVNLSGELTEKGFGENCSNELIRTRRP